MFCTAAIDDIVRNLHECSSGLVALNSSTEDDFLTTGTDLRKVAAHVVIRIEDDEKGLDREAILAKAIDRGLASPTTKLSDGETLGFIFHPGFSTAKEVTNVSGRGVGMDVVRKAIDALKGSIDVSSEKGKGKAITIKLPLTLAIVEGLLVALGDRNFVLPLSIVEECVELRREDVNKSHGRNLANILGEIVPHIRLRNEFNIPGDIPPVEQIVVTGGNGDKVGFVVDSVIGTHQTVIKDLRLLTRRRPTGCLQRPNN
jgi:two-component system chemotaxis sensor kinase CheA